MSAALPSSGRETPSLKLYSADKPQRRGQEARRGEPPLPLTQGRQDQGVESNSLHLVMWPPGAARTAPAPVGTISPPPSFPSLPHPGAGAEHGTGRACALVGAGGWRMRAGSAGRGVGGGGGVGRGEPRAAAAAREPSAAAAACSAGEAAPCPGAATTSCPRPSASSRVRGGGRWGRGALHPPPLSGRGGTRTARGGPSLLHGWGASCAAWEAPHYGGFPLGGHPTAVLSRGCPLPGSGPRQRLELGAGVACGVLLCAPPPPAVSPGVSDQGKGRGRVLPCRPAGSAGAAARLRTRVQRWSGGAPCWSSFSWPLAEESRGVSTSCSAAV